MLSGRNSAQTVPRHEENRNEAIVFSQSEQIRFYHKRLRLPWRKMYMLMCVCMCMCGGRAGRPTKSKHLLACFQSCLVRTSKSFP